MTDSAAVARAVDRIRKRADDPRLVLVPGLADDLVLIGEALASTDTRLKYLERAVELQAAAITGLEAVIP